MQGDAEIIEILNDVLTGELTAINQYFVHAKMCDNWGYHRLAEHGRDESIDEMKHADVAHRADPLLRRRARTCSGSSRSASARPSPSSSQLDLAARVRRRRAAQHGIAAVPSPRATTAPASCSPTSSSPRRTTSTGWRRSWRRSARSASSTTSPSSCTTESDRSRSQAAGRDRRPASIRAHDAPPGADISHVAIARRGPLPWRSASPSTVRAHARRRAAHAARALHPRTGRADRHQHRLRHVVVRRLHGPHRRRVGEELHGARRAGRRRRHHHDRGPRHRRRAAPDAAGVHGEPRPAVRLLHARHGDGRRPACSRRTPTRPSARCASGSRATSAAAPATTTSSRPCSPPPTPERASTMTDHRGRRRPTGVIGQRLLRREDPALLTGEARFTNDLDVPGALHLARRAQPVRPRPHHVASTRRPRPAHARRRRRLHRRRPRRRCGPRRCRAPGRSPRT